METRVSSNEVDYYLQGGEQDRATIVAICRDWLDMQARLGRVEAVVSEVRQLRMECQVAGISQDGLVHRLAAVFGSLIDYDATQPTEDSDG